MALWMDGVVTSVKLGTLGGVLLGASYGLDRLQSWALPRCVALCGATMIFAESDTINPTIYFAVIALPSWPLARGDAFSFWAYGFMFDLTALLALWFLQKFFRSPGLCETLATAHTPVGGSDRLRY